MKLINPIVLVMVCLVLNWSCGDDTAENRGSSGRSSADEEHDHGTHNHEGDSGDATAGDSEDGPDDPPPPPGDPNVVEFHIANGTGNKPWNTAATVVSVPMGKILRVINDDETGKATAKRLHTNGAPCEHGDKNIPVGGYIDCEVVETYNFATDAPLYNHNIGPAAQFFVKTLP